jgi:glycine cleavage system pyridoxal-binding protein P
MAKKPKANRVTEEDDSNAALRVLTNYPNGEASIQDLKKHIPNHLTLSADDLAQSKTRRNEAMWEQQIRNITSHHKSPGNFIYEGYVARVKGGLRITDGGRLRLKHKGKV